MATRRKQKIDYTLKFNNMKSIYDTNGDIDYSIFGDSYNLDKINEAIFNARQKGWGSVNIGNTEYTLYQKLNDKIVPNEPIVEFVPNKKYTEDQLAVYNWNNRKNPSALQATKNYTVGYSPINPPILEPEGIKVKETIPDVPITNSSNNKYNVSNDLLGNILSIPLSGRKSNFRQTLGLYEDLNKYFENPKVSRSMDYYYGRGNWEGNYYPTAKGNVSPKEAVKNVLGFVYNNADLTNDRMGKTQDYLIKESKRIGRTIGGYDNLRYYDLLNMFSPENSSKYSYLFDDGKYKDNYKDFYKRLYNLSASRNGMQGGELLDLFGDNWRNVLGQIINTLEIPSNLNGGILRMLFI